MVTFDLNVFDAEVQFTLCNIMAFVFQALLPPTVSRCVCEAENVKMMFKLSTLFVNSSANLLDRQIPETRGFSYVLWIKNVLYVKVT